MEKIELPKVRDLGQTIGDPFLFAKANFGLLFKGFLYYGVPPLLVAVGLSVWGYSSISSTHSLGGFSSSRGFTAMFGLWGVIAYVIYVLTLLFQQLYVSQFMVLSEHHSSVTNADVLAALKHNAGNIFISFLALFGIAFAAGIVLAFIFASTKTLGSNFSGFLVFVFMLVLAYVFIPLSNFLFIRLRENLGVADSVLKAFQISSGNWWRTFIAMFVILIIFYAFLLALIFVFAMAISFMGLVSAKAGRSNTTAIALVAVMGSVGTFVYFFVINMMHVFTGINYFSLSEKHDSYHLKAEINELGQRDDRNIHRQEGEY